MEKQVTSERAGTLGSRTVFSQETFEFLRTEVRQNILVIEDESRSITLAGGFDHLVISGAAAFDTVTVTDAAFVLFDVSRAIAVSVCDPLLADVVFHVVEYGDDVSSAPMFTPSSWNWTPATPMLSDALAETVTALPETVVPLDGAVILTDG